MTSLTLCNDPLCCTLTQLPLLTPDHSPCKFSCRALFQNNSKFTHSVPSFHFICISWAPRQSALRGAKLHLLHLLHHDPGDNPELQSVLHQLPSLQGCTGNSDPIPLHTPSGSEVLWDTRFRALRHSGVWLIPWKWNYFQSTKGTGSWISRSYKYDYYGINCCSLLLSSWPKLHFSGIPLIGSIHFSD